MDDKHELKLARPKLGKDVEDNRIEIIDIADEDIYRDICISDCKLENQKAGHVSFERVVFRNVELNAAVLDSLELIDVRFANRDLSNADFNGAIIHRTEFVNCKLVGLSLSDAVLQNVCMDGCNCRFALVSLAQ